MKIIYLVSIVSFLILIAQSGNAASRGTVGRTNYKLTDDGVLDHNLPKKVKSSQMPRDTTLKNLRSPVRNLPCPRLPKKTLLDPK